MDGARISSGFGPRKHPILGYTRLHRGVDFAAPKGTEVYASGDGVVEKAGRAGGLGIHVRIKHAEGYSTVYGHLSRLAKDLKKGDTVKQGQVIGLVGSTGLSTGPHLHYEVWRDEDAIDPASIKFETRLALAGDALAAFRWQAALVMMKPAVRLAPVAPKTAQKQPDKPARKQ
ncbi:MAG: M23 family metallopeptidase [Alphaproteobacteria bacterium]|nr:M23 family metallopeptidase [Alphaproteobacteria bacterium]